MFILGIWGDPVWSVLFRVDNITLDHNQYRIKRFWKLDYIKYNQLSMLC